MQTRIKQKAFTLIELLVVIAIIGLLASIVLVALNNARAKARNAKRLADTHEIISALELYYSKNNAYPGVGSYDCGGWNSSSFGNWIPGLVSDGDISKVPTDPLQSQNSCSGYQYRYYLYGPTDNAGCNGTYYVLGIVSFEGVSGTYPGSPGFNCGSGNRDWQTEFQWVTGEYE